MQFWVDDCWLGRWRGQSVIEARDGVFRLVPDAMARPDAHLAAIVLPGFVDAHVHLGLVDTDALLGGGIAAVDDLGWDPAAAGSWAPGPTLPTIRFAGAFLTAPGGYPSGRAWAPDAAVEELRTRLDAVAAVDRQLAYGASFIKVTLNSDAGPVLDDDTLSAVVSHAHSRGTTVTAHAEGAGQAARAFRAGVDRLAHTPWTERLDEDLLAGMVAAGQVWISTLDIHGWGHYANDFAVASDNLRRFHALGGTVRYGTDLGNGALPVGINVRELHALEAAGMRDDDLLAALVTPVSAPVFGPRISVLSERSNPFPDWLATATVVDATGIKEHLT